MLIILIVESTILIIAKGLIICVRFTINIFCMRVLEIGRGSNKHFVRFQPKSTDRVTQQIQGKLGNFSNVRGELLDDPKRLIGLDAAAQSPAPSDLKKAPQNVQHHRYKEPPPPSSGHPLSNRHQQPPPAPAPPHQHSPRLNGAPKPHSFSRPASKGLAKLEVSLWRRIELSLIYCWSGTRNSSHAWFVIYKMAFIVAAGVHREISLSLYIKEGNSPV